MDQEPRTIRRLAGWSQLRVAALAETTPALVRLFEVAPDAVTPKKRLQLARVYRALQLCMAS